MVQASGHKVLEAQILKGTLTQFQYASDCELDSLKAWKILGVFQMRRERELI